jgi:hypothetical protein
MFCCLFAALLLGPMGLWAIPRAKAGGVPDCCNRSRHKMAIIAFVVIAAAMLCLAGYLLAGTGPEAFRHICSVWRRS